MASPKHNHFRFQTSDGELFSARWKESENRLAVVINENDENSDPGWATGFLDPDQTRSLFRYLAGIVLPRVERVVVPDSHAEWKDPWIEFDAEPKGPERGSRWVWMDPSGGIEVGGYFETSKLTPAQARALAACLLAAADEAEEATNA